MTQEDITIVTELCELRFKYKQLEAENERLHRDAVAQVKTSVLTILGNLPEDKYVALSAIKNVLAEYLTI